MTNAFVLIFVLDYFSFKIDNTFSQIKMIDAEFPLLVTNG